jgi:hypothetical protein
LYLAELLDNFEFIIFPLIKLRDFLLGSQVRGRYKMNGRLFHDFLASADTLWVYSGDRLLFTSAKDGLLPLLDYIDKFAPCEEGVTVFDRVVGNAAALLLVKAGGKKVYSPLGSELAARTLDNYAVEYHFSEAVPYIRNRSGQDMCPMEKSSLNKSPEEFYELMKLP